MGKPRQEGRGQIGGVEHHSDGCKHSSEAKRECQKEKSPKQGVDGGLAPVHSRR